jgi:deoxyribose-phosphate aldolase
MDEKTFADPTKIDQALAAMIDHTLLKPEASQAEIETLCREARAYGFCSVCVNTTWVARCRDLLQGSGVKVCCVVGFPLGAMATRSKAFEAQAACEDGADEVDMVLNIGAVKSGNWDLVEQDIRSVVEAAAGKVTKVILETGLLTEEEKVRACTLCKIAGASFVKTSTGFVKGSVATEADIALMRKTVGPLMGVKASGGVRSLADAKKMIAAGATRIGASSGVAIVTGGEGKGY